MRKIMTREDAEKKQQRNKTVIGILLGIILLFSSAGYFFTDFMQGKSSLKYKGVEFNQNEYGLWVYNIGGKNFQTIYSPIETENISKDITLTVQDYFNKPLYIAIDEQIPAGSQELENVYGFVLRWNYACLNNCSDYPIKNCSDNVIAFKYANESKIMQVDNCIYLYYDDDGTKVADAFVYRLLGLQ